MKTVGPSMQGDCRVSCVKAQSDAEISIWRKQGVLETPAAADVEVVRPLQSKLAERMGSLLAGKHPAAQGRAGEAAQQELQGLAALAELRLPHGQALLQPEVKADLPERCIPGCAVTSGRVDQSDNTQLPYPEPAVIPDTIFSILAVDVVIRCGTSASHKG